MKGFLNDLSISPNEIIVADSTEIVKLFLKLYNNLRDKYNFRKIRVPSDLVTRPICGSLSFSDLLNPQWPQYNKELASLLLSFMQNRLEFPDAEISTAINEYELDKLLEVNCDGSESVLLKEAFILNDMVLSLATLDRYMQPRINVQVCVIRVDHHSERDERLNNCSGDDHVEHHAHFLLEKLLREKFEKFEWEPIDQPCWNNVLTTKILEKYNYPNCKENVALNELRGIYQVIASEVLEANGWIFDPNVTRLNIHRPEIWKIYRAHFSRQTYFISVDLQEGEFEMQNRRGKWVRTVFLDGAETGKDYTKENTHNINTR